MKESFKKYLLQQTKAQDAQELEVIQSLWSGYGKISRYILKNTNISNVVVKHINLEQSISHPRGWDTNLSHQRKVQSYAIETYWYQYWSKGGSSKCPFPAYFGSLKEGKELWIILEDLNKYYPLRKQTTSIQEIKICLNWLAHFHAQYIKQKPEGLWPVGTYWHLATRPDELKKIHREDVRAKAHLIDEKLNQCSYKTIVHGDAKLANFCFSYDGKQVAAVDFQYVGGGCGMKDVAYFLGSCLNGQDLEQYQDELLDYYFEILHIALLEYGSSINFKRLKKEWHASYFYACADFTRFLLGWMPSHSKINAYQLRILETVLAELSG